MSGFRGTIGSPKDDKVVAWIYNHVESMEPKVVKSIFKFIHYMCADRNHLLRLEDKRFRERMAKLVRAEYFSEIDGRLSTLSPGMKTRLRNMVARNYRQAIGAGRNAPTCGWCEKPITMEQPFKLRNGGKMHYKCATAFDKA